MTARGGKLIDGQERRADDRALIVDTGSTDGTPVLVAQATAWARRADGGGNPSLDLRLEEAPWPGRFDLARQRAYERLRALWPEVSHVMRLDGDDELHGGALLRPLAAEMEPPIGVLVAPYRYAFDAAGDCTVEHAVERLVDVYAHGGYKGPVHDWLVVRPGWQAVLPVDEEGPLPLWVDHLGGLPGHPKQGSRGDRNLRIALAAARAALGAGREPEPSVIRDLAMELAAYALEESERMREDGREGEARRFLVPLLLRAVALIEGYVPAAETQQFRDRAMEVRAYLLQVLGDHKALGWRPTPGVVRPPSLAGRRLAPTPGVPCPRVVAWSR